METLRRGKTTRGKSEEKAESLSYDVTDSVKGAEMMMRKKRAQTQRGFCRLLPNEDSNHE